MTRGYRTERLPLQMRWSVPQRPASVTWTSTSSAPGSGGAMAWTRRSRGPWRTAAFMADNLPGGMAAVEDAREIRVHHEAPIVRRHLGERRDLGDAGVVHDDVEPPELADRAAHQRLDLCVARDVGGRHQGAAPGALDERARVLEVPFR